jgi:predicted N-acyltransferase
MIQMLPTDPRSGVRYHVRLCDDIDAIEPAEWDGLLAPEDVQASHRFVKACRDSGIEGARYRHLLLYDARGLAAIATFSFMFVSLDLMSTRAARGAVALVRGMRPGFLRLPLAMCGLPVSFGDSCLRLRWDADPRPVLEIVTDALAAFGEEQEASVLCLKEFTPSQAKTLAPLGALGYIEAPSLPTFVLPLRWPSLEAYLGAMRAGYRRQANATRAAVRAAGLTTRVVTSFGAECPRIFALYEQVIHRAPVVLERLNLAFFERLAALGPESRALLLERDGELLAAAVLLRTGAEETFLLAGIDYERSQECQAYPGLVLAVVEEAIRSGARRLRLGQTGGPLKTRLGGEPEGRVVFLRYHHPWGHRLLRASQRALFPARAVPARRVFRT